MSIRQRLAKWLGIAAIATTFTGVATSTSVECKGSSAAAGASAPCMLQLQFADTEAKVTTALQRMPDRESINRSISLDYIFIACYALLFILMGALQWTAGDAWRKWTGAALVLAGAATAAVDIRENMVLSSVINQASNAAPGDFARVKWLLTFVTLGFAGTVFHRYRGILKWVKWALAAAAFIGVLAVILNRLPFIGLAIVVMMTALLLVMLTALMYPDAVASGDRVNSSRHLDEGRAI
jgi:magnesium-transporting ATPase (P-type)